MSFWTSPMVAAKNAVMAPISVTTVSASTDSSKIGDMRATRKTPAVTMVAAWISAETGVGPSMASGNQVCSRNCADLPIAPMNSSRQVAVSASPRSSCNADETRSTTPLSVASAPGMKSAVPAKMTSIETEPNSTKTPKMPSAKAEIADPVDDEGLDGRGVGRRLLVPEADQQVGRKADAFPAEEHLHQVVGRHQHQHGEGEQRQIGEEARPVRIVVHVADRIDVDQARHRVDDHQHHRGQRVDAERPVDRHRPGFHPRQHRMRSVSPSPSATWKKAIQDSSAATTIRPQVMYSQAFEPIERPKQPGDDRSDAAAGRQWRDTWSAQPFIILTSSTAMEPRLR